MVELIFGGYMRDEKLEAMRERETQYEKDVEKQKQKGMSAQVGMAQADLDAIRLEIQQHLAEGGL